MYIFACFQTCWEASTGVVQERGRVLPFPVCNTSEIHPTQLEKQLLVYKGFTGMSV